MKIKTIFFLIVTHIFVGAIGFSGGIYVLPILIAPPAPNEFDVMSMSSNADYSTKFIKDLQDSDAFHWGEGQVSIGADFVTLKGKLAPGPDYKLYLSPEFVETEADFNRLRSNMVRVGDVRTFDNFVVKFSPEIDPSQYDTVIVWCETFGEFM